ncbi:hypothetical protein CRT23_09655 [Methylobacterium sp. V23]|nr:hypothetical protein CRT23_09655 [Methylobacterium sp. V23]
MFSDNQPKKILIGFMIANDEINISQMQGRATDRDLIVFAYDVLTEQRLLFDEKTSPHLHMYVDASLARLLVDLGRTDDARIHRDTAQQSALKLNDTRMIKMLDDFEF